MDVDRQPDELQPGDPHYTAYVGPPAQYDFMGATQFRLLCALGLRSTHRVLDFGCGSLRAGRLLIPYLDRGNYFGVEPNEWLIQAAVAEQLGQDLLRIKQPVFDHNGEFSAQHLGTTFDYVVAQSIFSHTNRAIAAKLLREFASVLSPRGRICATFIEGREDPAAPEWTYPGCVCFRRGTIREMAGAAGLSVVRLRWFHPRQRWYVFARTPALLPTRAARRHLRGAVLFDREFLESWHVGHRWLATLRRVVPHRIAALAAVIRGARVHREERAAADPQRAAAAGRATSGATNL